MIVCVLVCGVTIFGIRTTWNIESDVTKQLESQEESEEQDGVQIAAQTKVANYLMMSLICSCLWFAIGIESIHLADKNLMGHEDCTTQKRSMIQLGIAGVMGQIIMVFSMFLVARITSLYLLAQTMGRAINGLLTLLGFMLGIASIAFLQRLVCLAPDDDEAAGGLTMFIFGFTAFIGITMVVLALLGCAAQDAFFLCTSSLPR